MSFTSAPLPKLVRNTTSNSVKIETYHSQSPKSSPVQPQKLKINIKEQEKQKEPPRGNILHISNISTKLTYQQIKKGLYNLFSVHGPIFQIIIKTKDNGQHFAFVDFPDINDAQKAWRGAKYDGKFLQGKKLLVNYCQDPKKNHDRKDQKCFLCHGTGHKAIKCPVKPELIKPKEKKVQVLQNDDQTCDYQTVTKNTKQVQPVLEQYSDQQKESSESEQNLPQKRDKDYLRFLKLKKKLIKQRLKKKSKKSKKRQN